MAKSKLFSFLALAGSAVITFMLGMYAWAGTFARYWADDYCYSGTLREFGLIGGIANWYVESGNRFSTLIPVWISERFGEGAIRWLPALILLLLLVGWVYALSGAARLARVTVRPVWIGLAALLLVYFNMLLAVDRLQSLYWRMGTLHYTLPLALLLFAAGWIVRALATSRRHPKIGWALGLGLFAFLAAGLSETFAAAQAGLMILAALLGFLFASGDRFRVLRFTAAPLVGSLLAMAVMMGSPSNEWRMAAIAPAPGPLDLVLITLRYAFDFTFFSFRGQPVPLAAFAVGMGALAYLGVWKDRAALGAGRAFVYAGLAALMGFAFLCCAIAPSVYAGGQYPAGRAMMVGRFAFLAGWGGAFFFAAAALASLRWRVLPWLAAAGLALACLYPLRGLPALQAEAHELQIRAVRWDARTAEIHTQIEAGERDLFVREIDVAQGHFDMGPDSSFWVNRCVAEFYGVDSITANP